VNLRVSIVAALEALEDGDQAEAVAILLGALEDGPRRGHPHQCRRCEQRFEWPGLRSHHELLAHGYDHEYDTAEGRAA